MASGVAPLVCEKFSRNPRTEIKQGKQQQMVAHSMNGIAYPMQLKVRNAIHNLQTNKQKQMRVLKSFGFSIRVDEGGGHAPVEFRRIRSR